MVLEVEVVVFMVGGVVEVGGVVVEVGGGGVDGRWGWR